MLVSFSVSNFRSFAARQTFSLVASKRLGNAHESHALPIPDCDDRVLRAGVIYGANGAGKSNLQAALRYMRHVALAARKPSRTTERIPFRFADLRDQPSTFDIQFITADRLYRYSLCLDDERIIEERLAHVVGNKQRLIYERHSDSAGVVAIDAPGLKSEGEKLHALAKVGSRHNQSFLATVCATIERGDFGKTLSEVIDWLDNGLTLIGPESTPVLSGERLATDEGFRRFASAFLKASSSGFDSLRVDKQELSKEEAQGLAPSSLETGVESEHDISVIRMPNGTEGLVIRTAEGTRFYRLTIQAIHKGATQTENNLALSEESDGFQRLLDLIPALYSMKPGKAVYFIDEVDRSLHPMLVYKFLDCFLRARASCPRQIIVTTHESHLLDLDLLRRDEIWFAERDASGASKLYPLTEFNVRKDLQVRKGYLEGRFGAVPFLGEIDRLVDTGCDTTPSP